MIDFHTHVLPNIDDGSQSFEESIQMIKEAYKAGFTAIVSTSHYMEESCHASKSERENLIEQLNELLTVENIDVKIYNGAEAYVSTNLNKLIDNGNLPTINNTKYLLIELPRNSQIIYLNEIITDLQSKGIVPIIAHPERYSYVQENPNMLQNLIDQGVLFQANYGSIVGQYGKAAKKTLKKLLKNNMIHFLGTDIHSCSSIYNNMSSILQKLTKLIGKDQLKLLSDTNPRMVLNNELLIK
ncbi:MAG: capsular biosynthesis protein [Clostridia bacterium]|nr:capsular biosynthesis protein [Clostridia bacterium]